MSSRARRISPSAAPERFAWGAIVEPDPQPLFGLPETEPAPPAVDLAALEREAFTKGYAQGERAGTEAGNARDTFSVRRDGAKVSDPDALVAAVRRRLSERSSG